MSNRPQEQKDEGNLAGCVLNSIKRPQERNLDASVLSLYLFLPIPPSPYLFLMPPRPYMIDKHYSCTLPALRHDLGSLSRPTYARSG